MDCTSLINLDPLAGIGSSWRVSKGLEGWSPSHLVAAQGELDVIQDRHKSMTQKVAELEKGLHLAYEDK